MENKNKLVECKAFVDSVVIKSANLEEKCQRLPFVCKSGKAD